MVIFRGFGWVCVGGWVGVFAFVFVRGWVGWLVGGRVRSFGWCWGVPWHVSCACLACTLHRRVAVRLYTDPGPSSIVSASAMAAPAVALVAGGGPADAPVAAGTGWLADLGQEDPNQKLEVYLVTFSRALPAAASEHNLRDLSQVSHVQIAAMFRDALHHPIVERGRHRHDDACPILKMVVFQELHTDGTRHYHIAAKLNRQMRFLPFKRTLRVRHRMCSHWSCSHRQWWSVVRYGVAPSPTKPVVDEQPLQWTATGAVLDLYEDSQQPYNAVVWRHRREKRDSKASQDDVPAAFTKLDFMSLVLSKNLLSRATVLAYVQEHGSVAMQNFVCKSQRLLDKHIEDALEWGRARLDAERESETDWALVCRTADGECNFGAECQYARAAQNIFEANEFSFKKSDLAVALRAVMVSGPSKVTRVPFLVGPTNCGKSTLLYPFDEVFGFHAVFHKPSMNDVNYPLRNWLKAKRFVLWDDFRPADYAESGVVPVAEFLSMFNGDPFEVRVPQNTHDGNVDFVWKRGVAFTGKSHGLWTPTKRVSEEDMAHMRSRVLQFNFTQPVQRTQSISKCARCLCRWIVDGAAQHDASVALGFRFPALPNPVLPTLGSEDVQGFQELILTMRIPADVMEVLRTEVMATGAVDVRELKREDWTQLPAWGRLREMERRRICSALGLAIQ